MRKHNKYTTNLIILVKRLAASKSTNIVLKNIIFHQDTKLFRYIYNYKIVHCQVNILDQFTTKFKI